MGIGSSTPNISTPTIIDRSFISAPVVQVASARHTTIWLTNQGTVYSAGKYNGFGSGTPTSTPGPINMTGVLSGKSIIAVAASAGSVRTLASDGTISGWGANSDNELDIATSVTEYFNPENSVLSEIPTNVRFTSIQGGETTYLLLGNDSNIYMTGFNRYGQFGNGNSNITDPLRSGRTIMNNSLAGQSIKKLVAGYISNFAILNGMVATTSTPTPTPTVTTTSMPVNVTTSAPTNVVTLVIQGDVAPRVSGNQAALPQPVVSATQVLFTNASVTSSLLINLRSNATIPKEATIVAADVRINIAYVASLVQIAVVLYDEFGEQAGNVTFGVSTVGSVTVSLQSVLASLIAQYQRAFTIRAIRGSILKASLEVQTPDVQVNIDGSVTSTLEYSTPVTGTPTPTPYYTPNSLLSNEVVTIPQGFLIGIIVISCIVGAMIIFAVLLMAVVILYEYIQRKKARRLQEQCTSTIHHV